MNVRTSVRCSHIHMLKWESSSRCIWNQIFILTVCTLQCALMCSLHTYLHSLQGSPVSPTDICSWKKLQVLSAVTSATIITRLKNTASSEGEKWCGIRGYQGVSGGIAKDVLSSLCKLIFSFVSVLSHLDKLFQINKTLKWRKIKCAKAIFAFDYYITH